jgi:hypothetical protein
MTQSLLNVKTDETLMFVVLANSYQHKGFSNCNGINRFSKTGAVHC